MEGAVGLEWELSSPPPHPQPVQPDLAPAGAGPWRPPSEGKPCARKTRRSAAPSPQVSWRAAAPPAAVRYSGDRYRRAADLTPAASSCSADRMELTRNNIAPIGKLLVIVAAAFAFGLLVPLYDVFCAATGLNASRIIKRDGFGVGGLVGTASAPSRDRPLAHRHCRVHLLMVTLGLLWDMRPLTFSPISTREPQQKYLRTPDQLDRRQAAPSICPARVTQHFEKIDCFASQQTLAPGETREPPLDLSSSSRNRPRHPAGNAFICLFNVAPEKGGTQSQE